MDGADNNSEAGRPVGPAGKVVQFQRGRGSASASASGETPFDAARPGDPRSQAKFRNLAAGAQASPFRDDDKELNLEKMVRPTPPRRFVTVSGIAGVVRILRDVHIAFGDARRGA